jgi:magnesium chelatase subunit D
VASAEDHEDSERAVTSGIVAGRATLPGVKVTDRELLRVTTACAALGVDGMRGDLVTCRAAIAHAAWQGRDEVTAADVRVAARLALPHRQRRGPFDDPDTDAGRLDEALGPDEDPGDGDRPPDDDGGGGGERPGAPEGAAGQGDSGEGASEPAPSGPAPSGAGSPSTAAPPGGAFGVRHVHARGIGGGPEGRRSGSAGPHGRPIASIRTARRPELRPTLRAAAMARPGAPFAVTAGDLRASVRRGREANLIVLLLDTSGSMAARRRSAAVATAALSLLADAYRRRDRVALLTFRAAGATVVVPPTSSVELAARRLRGLPVGGRTPLAAGLEAVRQLVRREAWRDPARRPIVVVITDGRATGPGAVPQARRAAAALARVRATAIVVDAEEGPVRLGLAGEIARYLAADLVTIPGLAAQAGPLRERAGLALADLIRAKEAAA